MTQAQAMQLQQQVREGEAELEQCYLRMEKGDPPSLELEKEWLRLLRDEQRRLEDREERRMVSGSVCVWGGGGAGGRGGVDRTGRRGGW